jgi:HEAT repeat protein
VIDSACHRATKYFYRLAGALLSFRTFSIIAIAVGAVSLLSGASCQDRGPLQPVAQQTANPNAAIEANIQRLREAQDKLSKNPKDQEALSVFLSLLKDPNGINRSNAAAVLGEVGEDNGAAISAAAVPELINMVQNGDDYDQYAALKALRGFGPHATEAIPILRANLAAPDIQKTWVVAEALGRMKGSAYEAVPDLVKVIKANQSQCLNEAQNICRFAAQALGNIGPAAKDALPELISLLDHQNPYVRIYAAAALIRIQPKNQEALQSMSSLLKDQNVDVRRLKGPNRRIVRSLSLNGGNNCVPTSMS